MVEIEQNQFVESNTGAVALSPSRSARFNPDGVSSRFVAKNLSQVFGQSYDQKVPRQARPIIQRVESDKMMMSQSSSHGQSSASSPYGGSCSPPGVSHHPIHQNDYQTTSQHAITELPTGSEFRDRVQTAPTILRRQRKTTMIENNNTEDSLDEIGGITMEMPKPHQETKKGQKHRFPFKKNRDKQETVKDELKSRRRIRTDGQQLTPGRGGGDYSSQNNNSEGTTLRARSASTSTTERRRRTRRRRGNRKSGSNTGLDNDQIEKMSLEEALNVIQGTSSREGQTWQQTENLQCQVINGTTYFTPVGNYKTKESETNGQSLPSGSSQFEADANYNEGWSPDSGDKGLYDGGDTGTLFPEFKPRQFTKSEPMQRRTVKTGMPSKWNTAYDGEDISELKTKMSEFKSLWVANEKKQAAAANQTSQVQMNEHEQMMAATAEESAALALIESSDLTNEARKAEKTKINKNKICKLWESKEQNSTDMWEVEKPISSRVSPTNEDSIWSPPMNELSSLRISSFLSSNPGPASMAPAAHARGHQTAHLGIEAPLSSDTSTEIWSPLSNNWNPIPS